MWNKGIKSKDEHPIAPFRQRSLPPTKIRGRGANLKAPGSTCLGSRPHAGFTQPLTASRMSLPIYFAVFHSGHPVLY